jgi:hypothetical protein
VQKIHPHIPAQHPPCLHINHISKPFAPILTHSIVALRGIAVGGGDDGWQHKLGWRGGIVAPIEHQKGRAMTRQLLALSFGIGAIFLAAGYANAQSSNPNCGPHQAVVERLASGYGESRQSIALGTNNTIVEVFANLEAGSWTITVTTPGGPTCLVASGQAYQQVADALPNTDSPA